MSDAAFRAWEPALTFKRKKISCQHSSCQHSVFAHVDGEVTGIDVGCSDGHVSDVAAAFDFMFIFRLANRVVVRFLVPARQREGEKEDQQQEVNVLQIKFHV